MLGTPHPKARLLPKGTGLRTMRDGSWVGRGDRRGRQGSHAPGCTATGMLGWEEEPQGQHGQQTRSNTAGAHKQGGPASSQVRVPAPDAQAGTVTTAGKPRDQPCTWHGWALWPGCGIQQEKNDQTSRGVESSSPLDCLEAGNHSNSKGVGGNMWESRAKDNPFLLSSSQALALSVSFERILGPGHK